MDDYLEFIGFNLSNLLKENRYKKVSSEWKRI